MRRAWRWLKHLFRDIGHLLGDLGDLVGWLWRRVRGLFKWLVGIALLYVVLFAVVFSYQMIDASIGDPDADLVD